MQLYFHIGSRKAGSTFLQESVFSLSEEIVYHGKNNDNYPNDMIDLFYINDLDWELKKTEITYNLQKLLVPNRINFFSSEAATNTGYTYRNLKRIKEIFPEVTIIFVERTLSEIMLSHYIYDTFYEGNDKMFNSYLDNTDRPMAIGKCNSENVYEACNDYIVKSCRKLDLNLEIINCDEMMKSFDQFGFYTIGGVKLFCKNNKAVNASKPIEKVALKYIQNIEKKINIKLNEDQKLKLVNQFITQKFTK